MTPSARSWALPESAPSPLLLDPPVFSKRFLLWWRRLNTSLDPPEFVFIGQNNHGKTALLEAILGHSYTKDILNNPPPQYLPQAHSRSCRSTFASITHTHTHAVFVSFLDPCARKPTKRPVQINLLNNPACADPKVTVKRDDFLWSKSPEFCRDVEVHTSTQPPNYYSLTKLTLCCERLRHHDTI